MKVVDNGRPGTQESDGSLRFRNVVLAGSENAVDLTVKGDQVTELSPATGAAKWVALPPLADLHVHASRAYSAPEMRPKGLDEAARNVAEVFASFSEDDYRRHAEMLIQAAYRKGTTRIRTHADVDERVEFDALVGSLRAGESWAEAVNVEVVAFASSSADPSTEKGRELLRASISRGAQYLGAAPAFCANQAASIDAILDLAVEMSVPVDLHLDEHLDAENCYSEYLAEGTIKRGLQGRVTLSHGCAISSLAPGDRSRVVEKLAEAGIVVIALPRTNLYLQDAGDATPTLRGITCVKEMNAAGVEVRFASDNVQDAFYPYGDADLLGVAIDGVLASHLDDSASVIAAVCDGRQSISVGDPGRMVLFPGSSVDAVMADPPADRWLVANNGISRAGDWSPGQR